MKNPVGWFEIYVNDMSRAKRFYETFLELELTEIPDPTGDGIQMLCFPADMETYGASGALVKMKDFPAGGNSTINYFVSDDCAIEEARVVAAGGTIQRSKMSIGEHGFITLLIDTEGDIVGLHSMQ